MFWLIYWASFGLICGLVAKFLHPGEDPVGFLPTIGIGVAGSYVGGAIEWLIGWGASLVSPSGWIMSILGAVIFLWIYRKYRLNRLFQAQKMKDRNQTS
jgi:uncharacterized membrane protein YeaQ/YmgE (transglycosylase-associated protein family)